MQKQMVVTRITWLLHLFCIKDTKNASCSPKAVSAETSSNGKGFGPLGLMLRLSAVVIIYIINNGSLW